MERRGEDGAELLPRWAEEERRVQGRYSALRRRRRVDRLVGLSAEVIGRHLDDVESFEGVGEELVMLVWLHFLHQPRHPPDHHEDETHNHQPPATVDELSQQTRGVVLHGLAADLWPWAEDLLAFTFMNVEGFSEERLVPLLVVAQPIVNNTPLVGGREGRPSRVMLTPDEAERVFKRFKKSAIAYFFCGGGTKGKKKNKNKSVEENEAKKERDLFKKAKKRHLYHTDKWQIREDRRDQLLTLIGTDRMDIYSHVLRCAHLSQGGGLATLGRF
ncbi:uncharacterized protein ACA1_272670 [Acanthamoeba castellanii str. Neff]|uniref:Uncharacterized protein n=2 Tax=Acanthamoeba castellanii (strain ATCC 30010 / Neff) TaxID=1257118 RepID=L8HFE8_ACACF|nr:uncharacterized protein ACA1_272670 [Acanthamoeba castellanii str. Neff]ELR24244.1 hypothetical protein ACA1_272670 [Acanthamoeba castellanii str. Neff]